MPLARYQFTVTDLQGNVVPNAEVEVRREDNGALPQLFDNRLGSVTKGNSFIADANGFAFFYIVGGAYKITVRSGEFETIWRHVGIGLASETDTIQSGVKLLIFSSAGDLTIGEGERGWRIARVTPQTANIHIPAASLRDGLPLTIADGDGSFEQFPQTVQFTAGDTARGVASLVLDSNWQVITLYPQADNTWIVG